MSGTLTFGFYGKLPARADFVRSGLPRDFTDAWDAWLSGVMSTSKEVAGDAWLPAFLEAPVWRFLLPPGLCGAHAVTGLMLPSVDRAGRYFPLTIAAMLDDAAPRPGPTAETWLDHCEDAGRAALEQDLDPDGVNALIGAPEFGSSGRPVTVSEWWTEGSLRVESNRFTLESLPDPAVYAEMLGIFAGAGRIKARGDQ